MPGTNVNIGQITVNVNDTIPPDNYATVDAGTKVGTVYTKEQNNTWRKEIENTVKSGIIGVLKPNIPYDAVNYPYPKPWTQGDADLYEKYDVNESGVFPSAKKQNGDPLEVTAQDLEDAEVQIWIKNGVAEVVKKMLPQASVNIIKWIDIQLSDFPKTEGFQVVHNGMVWVVGDGKVAESTDIPSEDSLIWATIGGNLKLDENGGTLSYDSFLQIAGVPASPGTVSYNGSDFTVVGGYGDEGNGVMAFHPEYTGSRSTAKIQVHKDAMIEVKSMTNNINLPIRIPVLTILDSDQTTVIGVILNNAANTLETQTYTAIENCYVVASVANVSFLPQVELKITSFASIDLPTKVLTAENYKNYLSEKTLKDRIINGDTPTEVIGMSSQRQEVNFLKFKGEILGYWSEGWLDSVIKMGSYNPETNTVSNVTTIMNKTITGINAQIFKCPTAFVANGKVYLLISVWNPDYCILYESVDGHNFTEVSRTLANVAGFGTYGNHWIVPHKINGYYYWFIEGSINAVWEMKLLKSTDVSSGWQLVGTINGLNPNNGAKGGPCVHLQDGKFKMIYHYGPNNGANLPTYIAYAEADVNDPLYFKAFYLPLMSIVHKPFGNLTDQYADPELCEIDGKTYLFCSIVDNTTPRSVVYRWECDGRLADILNSRILLQSNQVNQKPFKLIVFSGESNSGGNALNTELSSIEKNPKSQIKILNNTNLEFENLEIGVNNLIDHYQLDPTLVHGWENGLVHAIEDGIIPSKHLVKTGQGGSSIDEWNEGGLFWNKFTSRVDMAISLLNITDSAKFILFYTQGINDALNGMSATVWKQKTIDHFNKIRLRYGNVPIIMPLFMSTAPDYINYNNAIIDLCMQIDKCHYVDTTNLPKRDVYHWNMEGQKQIAIRMVNKAKDHNFI